MPPYKQKGDNMKMELFEEEENQMSMKQADEAALRAMRSKPLEDGKCECGGVYLFSDYCGAYVCTNCGDHKGLCRCYCGWAVSGGDGRAELVEMGETIEEDC